MITTSLVLGVLTTAAVLVPMAIQTRRNRRIDNFYNRKK